MRTYICDKCGKQEDKPQIVSIIGCQIGKKYSPSLDFCKKCLKEIEETLTEVLNDYDRPN